MIHIQSKWCANRGTRNNPCQSEHMPGHILCRSCHVDAGGYEAKSPRHLTDQEYEAKKRRGELSL